MLCQLSTLKKTRMLVSLCPLSVKAGIYEYRAQKDLPKISVQLQIQNAMTRKKTRAGTCQKKVILYLL